MKSRHVSYLMLALVLGVSRSMAADSAKVTESVNKVFHGPQDTNKPVPAPTNTLIHDGEYLETESSSRAELLLPSASVTRLGSNSVFDYSVQSNSVDLQSGILLFCKPKDADQLNVQTAAVSAGITGTTGFLNIRTSSQTHLSTHSLGIIEGHTIGHAGGKAYSIGAGQVLVYTPGSGSPPVVMSFDVPHMVHTSILFTGFDRSLPNQSAIDREVASYEDNGPQRSGSSGASPIQIGVGLGLSGLFGGGHSDDSDSDSQNRSGE